VRGSLSTRVAGFLPSSLSSFPTPPNIDIKEHVSKCVDGGNCFVLILDRGVWRIRISCVIVRIQCYDPRLRLRGSSPVSRGGGV
jgi:hypothetical protein